MAPNYLLMRKQESMSFFLFKDEENVNKSRKEVGLQPLEEYLKLWDIKYAPIKSAGKE